MLPPANQFNAPRNIPSATANHAPAQVKQSAVVHYTFLLIGLSLLVFVLHKLDDLLLPLIYAILLSLLLMPLVTRLEKWRWPRMLAIATAILLVALALAGLFTFFGSQIIGLRGELPLIQSKLVVLFDQQQQALSQRFHFQPMSHDQVIDSSLTAIQAQSSKYLGSTLNTTLGVLSTVTLVPIYIFCFLYYRDHLRQFMFRFVEPDKRTVVLHTVDNIQNVVQGYMSGLFTVIVVVSIMNAVGLLALGVKYAIFFAIFASVLAVVPYVGIIVGSIIPALITYVETGSLTHGLLVVGVFMLVQFISDNILAPLITASKVSLNPLTAIIALILGAQLWGTPGMILSVPLSAVIKVVLDANKETEPWGFLLGDVGDGEASKKDPSDDRGFLTKLLDKVRGKRPPLAPEPQLPPVPSTRYR
ncbi:AI-2E family transporter [Hymenobacter sp. H14-R3]|uniref:AI-2E family transporter n=1 Tax=Hymenobacter sp. H14-R3 TaxID=3046308 RepID=UPI0024B89C2D|nr:AI-2E family transporter [Hymenobacter sp. H14-R3]MDJ0365380.1 AI-2E family transporter [Hymenobacter sp. H14-R3]